MSKTIATVNVIEMAGERIIGMASYPDNADGNAEAERRFIDLCTENGDFKDSEFVPFIHSLKGERIPYEVDIGLENGILEVGDWKVILTHSTVTED